MKKIQFSADNVLLQHLSKFRMGQAFLKRILAENNLSEPKRQSAAVQKEMLNEHRAARCK